MSTTTLLETSQLAAKIESKIDKSVSAATGLTNTGAMAFSTIGQIMEFAKVMAIAGVAVPKHLRENVGACLAVAIQASEWQMSPFAVASKTYVVNDRIAFEAQLVNAVILKRAPIDGRFKISYSGEGQERRCKVSATLTDGDLVDYESPALATIPVKNSPLWKGDPDQQLFYYSSRAMCRRHFPDVLLGIYTPEEMAEAIDVTATVREVPSARPALFAPKADVAPFPLDSLPLATNGASAGPDAASPSNGAAGTNDSPPAGAANPQAPEGASGAETPPGKTPARRTAPKAETLTLSDERESTYQRLTRKIFEAGLVHAKIETFLSKNDFPPLSMLSQTDAEQVLELFGALTDEAKS